MRIKLNGYEFEVKSYEEVEAYASQLHAHLAKEGTTLQPLNVLSGALEAHYKLLFESITIAIGPIPVPEVKGEIVNQ
jgi:hypothetical protein